MVTSQGRRKTGGGNASGLCRQVFRAALYSAASKSPSPSHTASAPYVFQIRLFSSGATRRARQRTDPRNWISVPCDTTSSGAGNRCFIVEINRLLLGKNPSPVFVNLIFGREQCGEKQGRAYGPPHSLPLPLEEEPPTGKPISQSARKQALAGNRVILDLVLILFTTSANTRPPSCKVFSALLSLRQKPFPPREELLPLQLVSTQLWHCELGSNWWPPPN